MARRGTPIPVAMKQEIRERRAAGETPTKIARDLKLSRMTVYKFSKQEWTETLGALAASS